MGALFKLAIAFSISVLLYLGAFGFVLKRPLTIAQIGHFLDHKIGYAKRVEGTHRLWILAGSNGRYSHSCAELETLLGHPCVNASIVAQVEIGFMIATLEPLMQPGDVVYMPLEYSYFRRFRSPNVIGVESTYAVQYSKRDLASFRPIRLFNALFQFDVNDALGALVQQVLALKRERLLAPLRSLNAQGDNVGATRKVKKHRRLARRFANQLTDVPRKQERPEPSATADRLSAFLQRARKRGIIVVGGLPTAFDDRPVPQGWITKLHALFERQGQHFLLLQGKSQYPRRDFFDREYHLVEEVQHRHTRRLASALRRFLKTD